jgi:hypothetical protein
MDLVTDFFLLCQSVEKEQSISSRHGSELLRFDGLNLPHFGFEKYGLLNIPRSVKVDNQSWLLSINNLLTDGTITYTAKKIIQFPYIYPTR